MALNLYGQLQLNEEIILLLQFNKEFSLLFINLI